MIVRKLRLQHGWSQDQLAQLSGLSIRTIQRIERGQTPGLDSLKSLAAVFDVHVTELQLTFIASAALSMDWPCWTTSCAASRLNSGLNVLRSRLLMMSPVCF